MVMARIVNSSLVATASVDLTAAERRTASRKLERRRRTNPLRRVRLACCQQWIRDPVAVVGDWLWCDADADLGRVDELAE
jgi:hypothetical protein